MSIAAYLREIGRGAQGARALRMDQAHDLMGRLLDGHLTDLEVGAFTIAMRMKGETLDELQGFLQALQERAQLVSTDRPVIAIASYNGARKLPNLVPLLALQLAHGGARVLVHGPLHDPQRVTTAEVFTALGVKPATTSAAAAQSWRTHGCAFVPIGALSAPLERLLAVRRTIGLRNAGHTIAKMLEPVQGAPCLRLMSHTHPEFGQLMASFAQAARAHVGLLRGTEGEAVADPRRQPRQRIWIAGAVQDDLGSEAESGSLTALPELPAIDAASTAEWIQAVLAGNARLPPSLDRQTQLLLRAYERMSAAPRAAPAQPGTGQPQLSG